MHHDLDPTCHARRGSRVVADPERLRGQLRSRAGHQRQRHDEHDDLPHAAKSACDILTQRVARSVLGGVAEQAEPVAESGSASVRISSCVRVSSLSELDRSGAVSLVMRVAHTRAGADANAEAFEPGAAPKSGEVVTGYGEKAFWNPTVGQLNILSQGNWYVLASGPIDPSKHTLKGTRKLADALADDF